MILVIRERATPEQIEEMLEILGIYIKVAVDIETGILAGGGTLHADCEEALLEAGNQQQNIWGADWIVFKQEIRYESLINIRSRQNNRTMEIQDPAVRERVKQIMLRLLGDV